MNYRQSTTCGLVAAAVTGSLLLGIAPAAMADDTGLAARRAAGVVEKATGTDGLAGVTAGGSTITGGQSGQTRVTVPETSTGEAEVTAPDGSTVALALPNTRDVTGIRAGTGTVVYPDAAPATDIAVQTTTDGGARALVSLKSDKAPTAHDFKLDLPEGTELVPNSGGGFDIAKRLGDGAVMVMGQVDAPWAKDATGKSLPTGYTLNGSTLTQTVDTNDAVFPVVADPKWTWGYVTGTVYFNKQETRHMAGNAAFVAAAFAFAPPPFDVYGVLNAANIARVANNAGGDGECVKVKVPTFLPYSYTGGYCN